MSDIIKKVGKDEIKIRLSILWIFITVNYIFCDLLSVMDPQYLKTAILENNLSGLQLTQGFLLASAIMMEIPFIMIVLSRLLNYRANRTINIIAGIVMILIQVSSMFVGTEATLHYMFFSIIEIACNTFIIITAFKWKEQIN